MTTAPSPPPPPSTNLPPPAEQTYDNAEAALFSPLHQSQTPDEIRRAAQRRTRTPSDVRRYLSRISLPHDDIDKAHCPNIVHITGTKGKGSTAAICESVLRSRDGLTTGLFTSPHLVDIRERIRIGGQPVSKEIFAGAYWEIRRRFEEWKKDADGGDLADDDELPFLPGYFRMLALMAAFIFAHYVSPDGKRVDVVILEVGVGGRYDATNIFDHTETNTVCGVTLIDYDHTRVLGKKIPQIAWEKGGIFQANKGNIVDVFGEGFDGRQHGITSRPASDDSEKVIEDETYPAQDENTRFYTISSNPKEVISVLQSCAFKEGSSQSLGVVTAGDAVQPEWKIGLPGDHQRLNAELAVTLCNALIKNFVQVQVNDSSTDATPSSNQTLEDALSQTFWPGRCQAVPLQVADGQTPITIRCDGAHTPQSLKTCLEWFRTVSGYDGAGGDDEEQERKCPRFLLFNCSHERNPIPMLQMIQAVERQDRPLFDQVYFCRADSERPSALKKASARELLVEAGILKDNGNVGSGEEKEGDDGEEPTSWQDTLANVWMALAARRDSTGLLEVPCMTNVTVGDALEVIKHSLERNHQVSNGTSESGDANAKTEAEAEVCVTGSLYMVGSALNAAEWTETPCDGHLEFDSKKVGAS